MWWFFGGLLCYNQTSNLWSRTELADKLKTIHLWCDEVHPIIGFVKYLGKKPLFIESLNWQWKHMKIALNYYPFEWFAQHSLQDLYIFFSYVLYGFWIHINCELPDPWGSEAAIKTRNQVSGFSSV